MATEFIKPDASMDVIFSSLNLDKWKSFDKTCEAATAYKNSSEAVVSAEDKSGKIAILAVARNYPPGN